MHQVLVIILFLYIKTVQMVFIVHTYLQNKITNQLQSFLCLRDIEMLMTIKDCGCGPCRLQNRPQLGTFSLQADDIYIYSVYKSNSKPSWCCGWGLIWIISGDNISCNTLLQSLINLSLSFGLQLIWSCIWSWSHMCKVSPYLGKDPGHPTGERLWEYNLRRGQLLGGHFWVFGWLQTLEYPLRHMGRS